MSENSYSLRFTPKASEDLESIYSYISNNLSAPVAADDLIYKMEIDILRLKDFPYSCSYVIDESLKARGYRKLIIDNYIVFYLVNKMDKQVVIMRILYGAQNYKEIL